MRSSMGRVMPALSLRDAGFGEKGFFKDLMVCHLSLAEPLESARSRLAMSKSLTFSADRLIAFCNGLINLCCGGRDRNRRMFCHVSGVI